MKFSWLLLIILISCNCSLFAQAPDSLAYESEKLYIHTDKEVYLPGETIWLKGYLLNSSYLSKAPVSNYIYVELYADTLLSRVKIKISEKGFAGHIRLGDEIAPGIYNLRCYTQNMQNYPVDYIFHKKIEISGNNMGASVNKSMGKDAGAYDIDVQFLPESGRYLVNRPARIAFKAIGTDGKSVNINVMLYNSAGTLVGQFNSRHYGMGLISLLNTEIEGYYAMVSDSTGFSKKIMLPKPDISGATINISRIKEKTCISAIATKDLKDCQLVIRNGSEELLKKPLSVGNPGQDNECNLILPDGNLPAGVNSAQLCNEKGEVVAERLFFISNSERPKLEILQNKQQFGKREKVELTVALKDKSGKPIEGEFSLAVIDSGLVTMSLNKENIVSYMELSSELRGEIEDPGYYFNDPSVESERYLDLVMMIHGWRYHTLGLRKFKREYSQEISGSVSSMFRKDPKNTALMIFAPSINLQQAYFLDKKSTFTLEGLDFPDSTKFLFGVAGRAGGQFYGINIQKDIFPPLSFSGFLPHNKQSAKTVKNEDRKNNPTVTADMSGTLKEVVVVAQEKEFYKPKYNPSPFLQSFTRGQLKEREELALYDQMYLQDYLVVVFPGLTIGSDSQGFRVLHTARGVTLNGPGEPLLYVDGLQWQSTALLDQYGLMVMDIENVAFLRGTAGSMYNTINGVILITTKRAGSMQNKTTTTTNAAKVSPLGYQKGVEFYSPKYESVAEKESKVPDLRSTLYWNPCVRTDSTGCATVFFYTGDRNPKLNISAEGVTHTGDYIKFYK